MSNRKILTPDFTQHNAEIIFAEPEVINLHYTLYLDYGYWCRVNQSFIDHDKQGLISVLNNKAIEIRSDARRLNPSTPLNIVPNVYRDYCEHCVRITNQFEEYANDPNLPTNERFQSGIVILES